MEPELVPKKPLIWVIAGRTRSRMPRAAVDAAAAGVGHGGTGDWRAALGVGAARCPQHEHGDDASDTAGSGKAVRMRDDEPYAFASSR